MTTIAPSHKRGATEQPTTRKAMNKFRFSIFAAAMAMCAPMAMAAAAPAASQNAETHASKSKFFRVATEGATCDGRTLQREHLEQMAATYDPKKYGARVNVEHIRGMYPNSDFGAYGDVLALETRKVEGGKIALFAQIQPLPNLIELNKARQKIYTSIEINPDFAETGKAYLQGLAVTDSPASLGTEALEFAAKATHNWFDSRKLVKGNFFSAAEETSIEFEEAVANLNNEDATKALGFLANLFSAFGKEKPAAPPPAPEKAQENQFQADTLEALRQVTAALAANQSELQKLSGIVQTQAQKIATLEQEPATKYTQRPTGTGQKAGAELMPDC